MDARLDDAARRCRSLLASLGAVGLVASRTEADGPRDGVDVDLTLMPSVPSVSGAEAVRHLAAPLLTRFRWSRGDLEVDESAAGHPMGFAAGRERTTAGVTPICVSICAADDTEGEWWDPPKWLPTDEAVVPVRRRVRRLPAAASDDDVVARVHARLTAPDLDRALVRCLALLGRPDVWSVDLRQSATDGGVWSLALLLVLPLVDVSPQDPFGTGVAAVAAEFRLPTGHLRRSPLGTWMVAAMETTRPLGDAPAVEALYVRTGIDPFDPGPVDRPVETREMVLRGRDEDGPDEAELSRTIEEALRDAVRVLLVVDVTNPVADARAVVRGLCRIEDDDIDSTSTETLADGRLRIVAHLGATLLTAEEIVKVVVASTDLHPWVRSVPGSADGLTTAEWIAPADTRGVVRVEVRAGYRLGLS
ncbi:hypothetical protein O7631_15215 [Micromonospora sp. WMMD967]|uniref:hypothetical protein n=1 Tax=Micromonospora sp. WMMD967 TaxID=3016101 RepID=UPI0024176BCD|nr:hypothetical protein [Micromonospora sp. WMMD967]MDG4837870.1 hypothetical protein [Micromonospora sp. WMMD967]